MTKVGIVYAITGVACPRRGGNSLLLDKLESGIVALETEYGPVYVQPSGWERLYLLWTFRHFNSLPLKTLNSRQRRLVERLPRCGTRSLRSGVDGLRVIGTVEGAKAPLDSTPLSSDPESFYTNVVLPDKLDLNLKYLERLSFSYDLLLLAKTAMTVLPALYGRPNPLLDCGHLLRYLGGRLREA